MKFRNERIFVIGKCMKDDDFQIPYLLSEVQSFRENSRRETQNRLQEHWRGAERLAEVCAPVRLFSAYSLAENWPASGVVAEGVRLGSNGLLSWCDRGSTWECDSDPNRALKKQPDSDQRKLAFTRHQSELRNISRSNLSGVRPYFVDWDQGAESHDPGQQPFRTPLASASIRSVSSAYADEQASSVLMECSSCNAA